MHCDQHPDGLECINLGAITLESSLSRLIQRILFKIPQHYPLTNCDPLEILVICSHCHMDNLSHSLPFNYFLLKTNVWPQWSWKVHYKYARW